MAIEAPAFYIRFGVDPVLRRAVTRLYDSAGNWLATTLHRPQDLELRYTDVVSGEMSPHAHCHTPYDDAD